MQEQPAISVVIPVYNEAAVIEEVVAELHEVLDHEGIRHEIVLVDDGSTDGTRDRLLVLAARLPECRCFRLVPHSGQSAALAAGIRNTRHEIVVMMDGDGQNDPTSIPSLLDGLKDSDMCCGFRAERRDTIARRLGSRIANRVRRAMLKDGIRDTGCTLKAVRKRFVLNLMVWDGMHRFLPALAMMHGARIRQVPVGHRPRQGGTSKYTNLGRLKRVVADLLAVRWMQRRFRQAKVENLG